MTKKFIIFFSLLLLFSASMSAQAPQVPEYVVFAGQTVRLDTPDRYERMDRELLAFSYMHSSSTLLLKRSDRVFKVIEPILEQMGVPNDLKYFVVIESTLDPQALSPVGAAGLWQFMATTARQYGLEVNANVDERYHIEKSTIAACKYLKDLYNRYGDWMRVAASYNSGPGSFNTRADQQRTDEAMDLWLPNETSRYMFRLLAAKMFFENPESFGFNVPAEQRYKAYPIRKIEVVTDPIDDLVIFANDRGVTYASLKRANLWLRETRLNNASHRRYEIAIPWN